MAAKLTDKSKADLELNLSYIDRTEAKIQSPEREVISLTESKGLSLEKVSGINGDENKCTEDINGNTPHKTVDIVTMATNSTGNDGADQTGKGQEFSTSISSENDERGTESFIDRKESKISVDTENMVKVFSDIPVVSDISNVDIDLGLADNAVEDSIPLNTLGLRFAVNLERMNNFDTENDSSVTTTVDSCEQSDKLEIKSSSETLQDEGISGKDRHHTYEIISATSNLLSFEKVHKEKNSDFCRDELDAEQGMKIKNEQSECSETSMDASMSPRFTKDSEQNVTIEEDEENVIIHLGAEFSQENTESEKTVTSAAEVKPTKNKNSELNTMELDARNLPSLNPIEVERKFKVTADSKIRLLEIGAKLKTEKQFHDTYFDSSNYSLILSDCWLRQRNSTWELKVTSGNSHQLSVETTYTEITNEKEIICYLVSHFHSDTALLNKTMAEVIEDIGLEPFAEFSTTRQTYFLPECTIDLDLSDFGFQVGEIEVMVTDNKRIAAALNTIDTVAEKLGVNSQGSIPGKVPNYLMKKNMPLYQLLVKAKIWPLFIDDTAIA